MAGMTFAYGTNSRSDMQPPVDPNGPTAMELNAMHKRERRGGGNTDRRGRGKGDGRGDRRQQHDAGNDGRRAATNGKNGKDDVKSGKGGKDSNKDKPKDGACHNCGIQGHWARECRKPPKKRVAAGGMTAATGEPRGRGPMPTSTTTYAKGRRAQECAMMASVTGAGPTV